jgi:hypothetical protein
LGGLGNLLPGSLGNKLKSQGAAIRGVQTKALRTTQAPISAQRKVDALKREGGRVTGGAKGGGSTIRGKQAPMGPQVRDAAVSKQHRRAQTSTEHTTGVYRVQTVEVDPGESLSLNLHIGSKKRRYPGGSFLYTIQSQQKPLESVDVEIPPVSSRGTVHFKSIAAWRYWLPLIISGMVVVMTLLSLIYYLTFL